MTMPNEDERRRLDLIEAALRASDPGLDRALRTFRLRRVGPRAWLATAWLTTVGVGLTGWWIVMLIMFGPLLALTFIALGARARLAPSASTAPDEGWHPPTSTR